MIDDLFEWLWPQPDPSNPVDLSLGEARWIRLYAWRTRFTPYRVYRLDEMWQPDDARYDPRPIGLREAWMWRGRTVWESKKLKPL